MLNVIAQTNIGHAAGTKANNILVMMSRYVIIYWWDLTIYIISCSLTYNTENEEFYETFNSPKNNTYYVYAVYKVLFTFPMRIFPQPTTTIRQEMKRTCKYYYVFLIASPIYSNCSYTDILAFVKLVHYWLWFC